MTVKTTTALHLGLAGFEIELRQHETRIGRKDRYNFDVQYGKQLRSCLTYEEAGRELGMCIMHALACEGKVNNEGDE